MRVEAEFHAGWIALRFLNAPERAEIHFSALAGAVGAPISLSRAYYWLGRAAEARGAADLARTRYRAAAGRIYTYYGQLAAERLGEPALAGRFAEPVVATPEDLARFSARPAVHALRILSDLNDLRAFLVFSYRLDDELETPGEYAELARLADRIGATHVKVRAGKVGVGRNAFAPDAVYPLVYVPPGASRFAPAEIILGLSRQESEFNPRAYSSAGARGLMQLLPSTAEITAKKEGMRYSRAALLDDPDYNMTLGAAHLSHLFLRFNNSRVMTFAAYNAGPNRVSEWMTKFGDPRSAAIDPVDWVELIPFQETRNYVQRVLENTQVYRARLTESAIAGRLSADLEIGGGAKRAGLLPGRQHAGALPPAPARTIALARNSALPETAPPAPPAEAAPLDAGAAREAPAEGAQAAPADRLAEADAADFIGDARRSAATAPKPPAPRLSAVARSGARAGPAAPPQTSATDPSAAAASASASEGPGSAALMTAAPQPDPAQTPDKPDAAGGTCRTYREFVAEASREDASAADLNAGMLAEIAGGGASCAAEPFGDSREDLASTDE
jgi:soluble lytic murein transglycosylase